MDPQSVRETWTGRTGEYSPAYYSYYGPDETSALVRERLDEHVGPGASVLELGCGSGRHLKHLADNGYDDLAGIDVDAGAFETMREAYPDLAATGTFHRGPIEALVGEFADGRFDAVYSVEALQHLHPDVADAFAEIARITGTVLVTAEVEDPVGEATGDPDVNYVDAETPLYYRDWGRRFTALGLREVDVVHGDRDTVRTFVTTE